MTETEAQKALDLLHAAAGNDMISPMSSVAASAVAVLVKGGFKPGRATYVLDCLARDGAIERIPKSQARKILRTTVRLATVPAPAPAPKPSPVPTPRVIATATVQNGELAKAKNEAMQAKAQLEVANGQVTHWRERAEELKETVEALQKDKEEKDLLVHDLQTEQRSDKALIASLQHQLRVALAQATESEGAKNTIRLVAHGAIESLQSAVDKANQVLIDAVG